MDKYSSQWEQQMQKRRGTNTGDFEKQESAPWG